MLKKKYYCVMQQDMSDCGVACLATVAKQYGRKVPLSSIRNSAGTDKRGTTAYGMIKAAEALQFTAKAYRFQKEDLSGEILLPAIAHVVMDESLLHYVVVHKIDQKKGLVVVADPAKGLLKCSIDEFCERCTGVIIVLAPSPSFKKGESTKSLFGRFWKVVSVQKGFLINIFITSIIYTALGMLGAFYFKFLMDDILPSGLTNSLHIVSAGIILLHVFQIILNAFRAHLLLYLSQKIDIPIILGYYNHVLDLPLEFFATRRVGEIISRFMDASHIRQAISGATLSMMVDTLMAIVGGTILFNYNATLFFVALLMLLIYAVIVYGFNKPLKEINKKQMEETATLNSFLIESLNGIETVKAFNAEEEAKIKTERNFVKLLNTIFKLGTLDNLRNSLTAAVGNIGNIAILWIGASLILQGKLTVGELLVFNSLLAYFNDPIKNLINLQPMVQTAVVASDRLGEILDLEAEKSADEYKKLKPEHLLGDIEFKNVDFRYGTRALTLKEINLTIKQGERIAFVGESGSGKTTLVKLLMDLYSPAKGEVLIGGNNVKDINLETLRQCIAYVPQETFLFSGSIRENLALGANQTSFEDMIEATKVSKAHDFINEMPLRYETRLEENGANLSGGQRQRLSITRAIMKKPDIMILDEATSSLDSITEKAIEKTIHDLGKGITTLVIAHRLSTIMRCDKIFVMEKGQIVETGTHNELMQLKGQYYELWKGQIMDEIAIIEERGTAV